MRGTRITPTKRATALLVAATTAVALVGCSSGEGDAQGERTVNIQGTDTVIPNNPTRIVATFNGTTQALLDAGGAGRIVAAQELAPNNVPPANRAAYEQIGTKIEMTAPAESLVSLKPDLFVSVNSDEVPNDDYRKLAPVAIMLTFGPQRPHWQERSAAAGEILNTQDKVAELKANLEKRQAEIKSTYASVLADNTFTFISAYEQGNVYAVGAASMLGELLTPAGVRFASSVTGPGPEPKNPGEFIVPVEQLGTFLDADIVLTASDYEGKQSGPNEELLRNPLLAQSGKIIQPIGLVQISSYAQANYILDRLEDALKAAQARG